MNYGIKLESYYYMLRLTTITGGIKLVFHWGFTYKVILHRSGYRTYTEGLIRTH